MKSCINWHHNLWTLLNLPLSFVCQNALHKRLNIYSNEKTPSTDQELRFICLFPWIFQASDHIECIQMINILLPSKFFAWKINLSFHCPITVLSGVCSSHSTNCTVVNDDLQTVQWWKHQSKEERDRRRGEDCFPTRDTTESELMNRQIWYSDNDSRLEIMCQSCSFHIHMRRSPGYQFTVAVHL